ncbi:MAG: ATP-binding protein [Bacteroidota bacterium]
MKEIVVISGKGGTGKTSLTASFAELAGENVVVADCDVDAADMHLLMEPDFAKSEDFYSGYIAKINQDKCKQCGVCVSACQFDAFQRKNGKYTIDPIACEGCGFCTSRCPMNAIEMQDAYSGKLYVSKTKNGNPMVHARLGIGADNSGKLVTQVKNEAKEIAINKNIDFIVVDGSPGIGCPVVSSLAGADFVVLVTEPSVSGFHDLKRVYELLKSFRLTAGCIINKSDLNPEITNEIKSFLKEENIIHLADLPYDEKFTEAMTNGKTIVEFDNGELQKIIKDTWKKISKN